MKALLLENVHPEASRLLKEAGAEVSARHSALDEAELAAALPAAGLLGIRSKTRLSAAVLAAAPDLIAVGAFCIGTDQVDLAAASALGIAVFNAPYSNTRSVVELTLAEIVALTRRLTEKDRAMHAGVWDKSAEGAHEVRGRTLGIVGYGNIGAQLSVVSEALGMRVVFYDTADKLALGNVRRCASLGELLEISDIVTLHVDGRPSNSSLFGEREFSRMRPGGLALVARHLGVRAPLEGAGGAYVLVEVAAESDPVDDLLAALEACDQVLDATMASSAADRARLWELRESHNEAISSVGVPVKLDVSVPASRLAELVERLPDAVAAVEPAAQLVIFGHLAEANLHVNVLGAAGHAEAVTAGVLALVASLGGSISSEHGIGRSKARWLHLSRSPAEIDVMRSIKSAFDPGGLLNPGVLLPADMAGR